MITPELLDPAFVCKEQDP